MGGDIRFQLPSETKRFDDIDQAFQKIMTDTSKRLNVLECCMIYGIQVKSIFTSIKKNI